MTAFVLVAGAFTGAWVWDEVAARLREEGAEAHPATLTGLEGGPEGEGSREAAPPPGPPGVGLETHIEDVVRLIDRTGASGLVLVGHGYGLFPVLGAADRRPDRVARIVSVDTGVPRNGDAAVTLVPDPAVRERLGHGEPAPPPVGAAWSRWGSTAGIPAGHLERLARRAVPQPAATLTRPLRLTGAADALPVTGLLCAANGSSLDVVRMLVESGPPQFRTLADDRFRFLELDTGHWPMLSAPAALASALLGSAAGEGRRVTAPEDELPAHPRPFVMDPPERPRERRGRIDLHLPETERPAPAVVFVHGGPVAVDQRPTPRDTPFLLGYGRYAAARGAVGVTLDHRLHALTAYADAAEDVAEAVARVRADPRVDADRIALWFFSTGGLLAADWLAAPPPWLRCVALTYPALAPLPGWGAVDPRFRPVAALASAGQPPHPPKSTDPSKPPHPSKPTDPSKPPHPSKPPIVLTRAGLEHPAFAATVQEFLDTAAAHGAEVEVVDVPHGHHGFELVDPGDESRTAVERAMSAVLDRLRA